MTFQACSGRIQLSCQVHGAGAGLRSDIPSCLGRGAFPPSSAPLPPPLSVLPLQKCVPTFRGGGGRLAGLGWAGLWRGASRIVDIPGPAALCAPIL